MLRFLRWFWQAEKKVLEIEKSLAQSFTNVKDDTNKLILWINHFHEKDKRNDEFHTNVTAHIYHHRDRIEALENELAEIKKWLVAHKGQVRTSQGTTEDMSKLQERGSSLPIRRETFFVKIKEKLPRPHQEVVNLLYNTDKPLSYYEIATRISKKEKSVRNLIYEIRKKGYNIKDKNIGSREKGFYLEREEKIKISGR